MNEIEAIELRTFFLWPLAITAIVAPITHCFVGRFWSGCLWSVMFACSVTTLAAFGLWLSSDLPWAKLMWLPGVFAQNASVAFPVSMLLGLPYVLYDGETDMRDPRTTPPPLRRQTANARAMKLPIYHLHFNGFIRVHHAHAMNIRLIVAIALATFPSTRALSQGLQQPPQITVSGSAEVKVAPDEIYLRVGVETRQEDLDKAKHENDERVSKALGYLKSNAVKNKDVQTDFISIEPTYDSNISRTKPVIYIVRKSIEIKLTRIDAFEGLLTGLLTNGVNNVHGIEFRTSQLRKHRDAARAMAIRAAKEKADALASELGVKRGKVYSINANDWGGWWSSSGNYWGGRGGGGMFQNAVQNVGLPSEVTDGTLSIGQISVSASVNVSFLIE